MSAAVPWIDWPLRVALSPVLVAQGLRVRRQARVLSEPPGARTGTTPHANHHLLILGDSSAAGVGCAQQDDALAGHLPRALAPEMPVNWTLMAKCGARTADALEWLDDSRIKPDIVVTALGVNDVTKGTTLGQWRKRQTALFDRLEQMGATRIFACALPPMGHFPLLPDPLRWLLGRQAEAFDQSLKALCKSRRTTTHVPFGFPMQIEQMAPDGYHPGPEIYAAWAQHLAGIIRANRAAT